MNRPEMPNRDDERLDRATEPRVDSVEVTTDAMAAGPAGLVEREITVRRTERAPKRTGGDSQGTEQRAESLAEKALHKTADALQGAAPAAGRGAEMALQGAGSALASASGMMGTMIGKIAGRVGGWWSSAAESAAELPEQDRKACMVHFEAYELRPVGLTFERALPGYTLGYMAARNPDYRGRRYEEIEPDLQYGFTELELMDAEALRDFSRYGYQRGLEASETSPAAEAREDVSRATGDLKQAARHTGEAARHAAEALKAGASGALERTQEVARETAHRAAEAADRMSQAQPDRDLESRAGRTTEQALHRTGDALQGAAPSVRKGVESTVRATGSTLHAVAGPLGTAIGKIAGKVGGWWSSSTERRTATFSEQEEKLCLQHFETYPNRPAAWTFDDARTAYQIGYFAADNPEYRERSFDDIEADLRHGLGAEPSQDYDALRDFARFGYERAMVVRLPDDEDRVTFR